MRTTICKKLYKELPSIIVTIIVFSPIIAEVIMYAMLYNRTGYITIGMEVIVAPMVVCAGMFSVLGWEKLRSKYSGREPISKSKRFTKTNSEGDITIDTEDIYEIIVYLNEVEDYFERRGTSYEK